MQRDGYLVLIRMERRCLHTCGRAEEIVTRASRMKAGL